MELGPGRGTLMDDMLRVSGSSSEYHSHTDTSFSRHSRVSALSARR